ncbi:MAG: LPD38 domain-containing protein [Candidatus Thorarchaeota archaeon]
MKGNVRRSPPAAPPASNIFDTAQQQMIKQEAERIAPNVNPSRSFVTNVRYGNFLPQLQKTINKDRERINRSVDIFDMAESKIRKSRPGELIPRFIIGAKRSVAGEFINNFLDVQSPEELETKLSKNPTFWEQFVQSGGELLSDSPFMMAGALIGSAIGGAAGAGIGAPTGVGVPFTASAGAIVGGGIGTFALPSFLKSALREYRNYANKGNDLTFGEFIQGAANRTIQTTLRSGANGAILSMIGPLMGQLSKAPVLKHLFNTKLGSDLTEIAATTGILTGTEALATQTIPTNEQFARSLATIAVFKLIKRGPQEAKRFIIQKRLKRLSQHNLEKLGFDKKEIEKIETATPQQIDKIVRGVQQRLALTTDVTGAKGRQVIALKGQNLILEDKKEALLKKIKPKNIQPGSEQTRLLTRQLRDIELKQKAIGDKIAKLEAKPLRLERELVPKAPKGPETITQITPTKEGMLSVQRTPAETRILNKIDVEGKLQKSPKTFNWTKIKQHWLDDVFSFKKMTADVLGIKPTEVEEWVSPLNPYLAARTYKGIVRRAEHFLEFGTLRAKDLSVKGKAFLPMITKLSDKELNELRTYLVAKRDLEKGAQGFTRTFSKKDAIQTVKQLNAKYGPIQKNIVQYQNEVLEYLRDSGRISQKQFADMQAANRDYVPFFRVFEDAEKSLGTGSPFTLKSLKRFKGSKAALHDPIESIIRNTYDIIRVADHNRVGQLLVRLSKVNPDTGEQYVKRIAPPIKVTRVTQKELLQQIKLGIRRAEIPLDEKLIGQLSRLMPETTEIFRRNSFFPQKNIISVWFDGKRQFYKVNPEIFEAFKGGMTPYEMGIFSKAFNIPASTLRAGAILNPRFIEKNIVRDWLGAQIFTRGDLDPIFGPFAGLAHSFKQDKLYQEWLAAGGGMATMQSLDKGMKRLDKYRTQKNLRGIVTKSKKLPIELLRATAELSEEANRLAEFKSVLKTVDWNTRAGKEFAAFASRDLSIDFNKIGLKARALNQIIPFWNATVQGTEKVFRTALKTPGQRWEAGIRGFLGIAIPSLLLSVANEGDPDVEELTEQEKDLNFVGKFDNTIFKIPVPFQPGMIFHGLARRFYNQIVKNNPNAWEGFLNRLLIEEAPGLVPQATKPFIEQWANRDFFTGQRIVPESKKGMLPIGQYKNYTSETAKYIGRAFQYLPDYLTFGEEGLSGVVIEHFTNSWFGGLGRLALRLSDEGLRAAGNAKLVARPEETIIERLGLNAFKRRYPTGYTASIEKFYDLTDKATRLRQTIKQFIKEGEIEQAKNLARIDTYPKVERALRSMHNMQATINNIFNDPTIPPHEKRILIDAAYRQMIEFARHSNKQIELFIKQQKQNQK